jgi:hypothetical protein
MLMMGHHTSRPGGVISLPKHAVRSVGRLAFRLGDVPRLGPGGGLRGEVVLEDEGCHFGTPVRGGCQGLPEEVFSVYLSRCQHDVQKGADVVRKQGVAYYNHTTLKLHQ